MSDAGSEPTSTSAAPSLTQMTPASPSLTQIAVAVVAHAGQYLIGLRPPGAPLAGYWEFPGGKLMPHEAPAEAATRECREETGLAVEVVGAYASVEHDYPHGRLRIHFMRCRLAPSVATPDDRLPAVPARFRWSAGGELRDYVFPPANANVLDLLARESTPGSSPASDARR